MMNFESTVWLYIALTVALGWLTVMAVQRGINAWATKLKVSRLAMSPLRFLIKWTGIFIILAICLDQFGIDLGKYVLSVLGLVAIGFVAVWSVLSNVSCTFILILLKPFQVGDTLEFPGESINGIVVDVNLVFTTLRDAEGAEYRIPNNMFFQKVIKLLPGGGSISLGDQLYREQAAEPKF